MQLCWAVHRQPIELCGKRLRGGRNMPVTLHVIVDRKLDNCGACEHNPNNMDWKKRVKSWFQRFPTICTMCTADHAMKRMRGEVDERGNKLTKRKRTTRKQKKD